MLLALLALGICLSPPQDPPLDRAWKADLNEIILGTPAIYESLVIVASKNGRVSAFRIDNGKPEWTTEAKESVISNLVVVKDGLYVPAGAESAVFDPLSGKIKKVRCPEASRAIPGASKVYLLGGLKFDAGYKLDSSIPVICLDPSTGKPAWKKDFGPLGIGALVESGGRILLAGQYKVYLQDSNTGQVLGQGDRTTSGVSFHGVAGKDRVVFQGINGAVACYDARKLKELWSWKMNPESGLGIIPPLIIGDRVILFLLPDVVSLDLKTGGEGWKQKLDGTAQFSQLPPAVRGKEVWVGANGKLFGIGHETGKVESMMEVAKTDGTFPAPQPVWSGDYLLYACGKTLHCLKAR